MHSKGLRHKPQPLFFVARPGSETRLKRIRAWQGDSMGRRRSSTPDMEPLTMPSYIYDPDTGMARLFFRYPNSRDGRQFNKTIRVADEREAARRIAQIEET